MWHTLTRKTPMRTALPNAFFFGLTGTPINRNDHNTFACFGAEEDKYGYISKFTFQNSVADDATLELNVTTVPEYRFRFKRTLPNNIGMFRVGIVNAVATKKKEF